MTVQDFARLGGLARAAKLTKEEASAAGRHARAAYTAIQKQKRQAHEKAKTAVPKTPREIKSEKIDT